MNTIPKATMMLCDMLLFIKVMIARSYLLHSLMSGKTTPNKKARYMQLLLLGFSIEYKDL